MSRDLAGYARSGAWSILAQATQMVGMVVLSVVVVRSLTVEQYGVLGVVRQVTVLVVIVSSWALERAALRFVPEILQHRGPGEVRHFLARTLALRLAGWVPWMAAVVLLGSWLERLFHVPLAREAVVGAATALVFSIHNHVKSFASARFATRSVAVGSLLGAIVTFGATVGLLVAGRQIVGVLLGAAAGMGVATLVMLPAAVATRAGPLETPTGERDPQWSLPLGGRRFLGYVLPFGGIAVLNYVVHSQTEMFFLTHFHGAALAAYFQLGFLVSQRLIDFVPLALWEVSMAGFSRIVVREPERLPQALRAYLTLLYLVIAPLACLGVAFSESVIRVLYEPDMLPATLVSRAYFVMAAVAAFGAPVGMIVYARERVGGALRAYSLFAVVNVALDLALIPRLGLWGAVLGLGLAKILAVLLISRLAWQEVPTLSVPWSFIGRAFAASTPVLAWMLVEDRWTEPWQVAAGIAVAGVLVVVSFRLLRVVGAGEQQLIAGTQLPLRDALLAVLVGRREKPA